MKFMVLIYSDDTMLDAMPPAEFDTTMRGCLEHADELRKEGQSAQVQKAVQELPEKIDHEQHAALLQKFGLDPGKLAQKAAERGIAAL